MLEETRRELALFASDRMGTQSYIGQFNRGGRPNRLTRAERRRLRDLIEASRRPYMVIDPRPGLHIIDINDAFAAATLTQRHRVASDRLFDTFPDNPGSSGADGVSNLFESLQRAAQSGEAHAMALQRYDVRDAEGHFVTRHWLPTNIPVFDDAGRLLYILHESKVVTPT